MAFVGDPGFAEANGLVGSQHDGWSGWAPTAELSDVRENETRQGSRRRARLRVNVSVAAVPVARLASQMTRSSWASSAKRSGVV